MKNDVSAAKAALRAQLRESLRKLPPTERQLQSQAICAQILASPCWQAASTVLFFSPLADEPHIWPLVDQALADGKVTALPRYQPVTEDYESAGLTAPSEDLVTGRFGVHEPAPYCPSIPWKQLDLILVPGLGFAAGGGRLGRGQGFYDRLLAHVSGVTLGVAFDLQIVDRLPLEPHDRLLNQIVTPSRWLT